YTGGLTKSGPCPLFALKGPGGGSGRTVEVSMEAGSLTEAIEAVVAPVARAHGLTVVDVDVRGGGRRQVVRIAVDRPDGVGVDDCQRLSREIGDILDVEDLLSGPYDLEVSSPGLDRELRKEREWRWAQDRKVRVWTREPVEGRRELAGRLVEV